MRTLAFAFAAATVALCVSGADFVVARRGAAPSVSVATPGAPGESRRYAAAELRKYVKLMTGVELPAGERTGLRRIVVAADASRTDDGFSIRCSGDEIVVSGSEERGALYGVYALLERFGCVFCAHDFEKVPRLDALSVPDGLAVDETPAFAYREFIDMAASDLAFCAKLRRNMKTWGRLDAKFGGRALPSSRRLAGHTFETLVPPGEYFAKHPEWFSEVKGRRTGTRSQLCMTNPELVDFVARRVLEAMEAEPGARIFSVSQNDWYDNCECAACKAVDEREGSPAGSFLSFVNAVADRTAEKFPRNFIAASAYQFTWRPPKTIIPAKNVILSLSPIECDWYRSVDSSRYAVNAAAADEMRRWTAKGGFFRFTGYTMNFSHYPLAFPDLDSVAGNLKFCRSLGVRGVCELGAHDSSDAFMQELRVWVQAKLAWNPDQDVWKLVRTFCDAYYGAAAQTAYDYLMELHQSPRDSAKDPLTLHLGFCEKTTTDDFLDKAYSAWTRAEELVKGDAAVLEHVKRAKFSVAYHIAGRRLGDLVASTNAPALVSAHDAAKWLVGYVESAKRKMIVSEHGRPFAETGTFRHWKRFAEANPVAFACGRGEVGPDLFTVYGSKDECETVHDRYAESGKAVHIFPGVRNWCVQFMMENARTDSGAKYRLRIRAKTGVHPQDAKGVAFRAGVCTRNTGATAEGNTTRRFMRNETAGGCYRWYDVGAFEPREGNYIWVSSEGPDGLWVDRIAVCEELEIKNSKGAVVAEIPAPTRRIAYGDHPAQYAELWVPEDRLPDVFGWPLAVYVHGGAWTSGKAVDAILASRLREMLDRGVAVASVSYRLLQEAKKISPPVKAVKDDVSAAILALKDICRDDKTLGVDALRLGLVGGSAGACMSLAVALTDDNALCVRIVSALYPQTTLDPMEMKEWVANQGRYGAHAFGMKWESFLARRDELAPEIAKYSPASLARAIDPSRAPEIVMEYPAQNFPSADGTPPKDPVHSAQFGIRFEELCKGLGIRCTLLKGGCVAAWRRLADSLLEHEIRRFEIKGLPAKVYYDSTAPIEQGSTCELAAVVVHGWGGGVELGWETEPLMTALRNACPGKPAPYVVAPLFPRSQSFRIARQPQDDRARWNDSWGLDLSKPGVAADDFRGGGDACGTGISSFAIIDGILAALGDRARYPNLKRVIVTGFSAGGQFVGRYVAVGKGRVRDGVEVVYADMAPSTEFRFDRDVPWHYGLKGRSRYAAALGEDQIMRNLTSRRVWRACGSGDTDPNGGLDSTPSAMLQGSNRYERFRNFEAYLKRYPDWARKVTFHAFDGLGHDTRKAHSDKAFVDFATGKTK